MWCIPVQGNAPFVCQMEAVLEVYKGPQNARFPVVCMDETSVQCTKKTACRLPRNPSRVNAMMLSMNAMVLHTCVYFTRRLKIGGVLT